MSIFEEEWKESGGDGLLLESLGPIADFNASFGNDGSESTIDTLQMSEHESSTDPIETTLSGPYYNNATSFLDPFENLSSWHEDHTVPHQQLTQKPYQSIELQPNGLPGHQQPIRPHLSFQQSYSRPRRSVSEPPSGLPYGDLPGFQTPQVSPQISFQRQHHHIGTPMLQSQEAVKLRPQHKNKIAGRERFHPYQRIDAGMRPEVRRTRTQPAGGPTSVPASPMPEQHTMIVESPMLHAHQVATPDMSPFQLVSTRVCTPTPSPERFMSPPASCSFTEPYHGNAAGGQDNKLSISVSVAQLQCMITEAVQKALGEVKQEVGLDASQDGVDSAEDGLFVEALGGDV